MASLGALLRELRLKHAVSLDDLARSTKIGVRLLEALETDDLARLPAPPFVKGFIRAYCEALREPPDQALALYRTALAVPGPDARAGAAPPARPPRARAPVLMSLILLAVLGVALLTLSLVLRGGRGTGAPVPETTGSAATPAGGQAPAAASAGATAAAAGTGAAPAPTDAVTPPATPPSGTAGGLATASAPARTPAGPNAAPAAPAVANAPPSAPLTATPVSPPALEARAPYRLVARASAPTWVRVRMGGGQTIEETIPGGESREWVSNSPFVLTIGNAGGLALELNGQALPPLGKLGAVVSRLVVPAESP